MDNTGLQQHQSVSYFVSTGFALYMGSLDSMVSLQSSINVEYNIGPTSMLFAFLSMAIGSLFISPLMIRLFGPKNVLIAAELLIVIYTAAFFKPNLPIAITAAILFGLSLSCAWSAASIIFAAAEESVCGKGHANTGKFFAIVSAGQIMSDAIAEVVLQGMKTENRTKLSVDKLSNSSLSDVDITLYLNQTEEFLTTCASNDCPESYSFVRDSPKFKLYIPENKYSVYILLSVFLMMQLGAAIFHWATLPSSIVKDDPSSKNCQSDTGCEAAKSRNSRSRSETLSDELIWTLKGMHGHLTSLQGVLTIPALAFHGILISFIFSEFNRSYVACTLGVEQVGMSTAIVDTFSLFTSVIIICVGRKLSLPGIYVAALAFDVANFVASLLWVPTPAALVIPYILAMTYGVSYGLRRNIAFLAATTYFKDLTSSFCVQSLMLSCGMAFTFAWSSLVCVNIKLYVMTAMTIMLTILIFIAHIRYKKEFTEYESLNSE
uniref:protein unc-93 homolog A-like isoform X1 n=1 Tax=Styela clava TaxID=7725 RepID=UPI0019394E98|nr:protein unc-93 homolog A-like isoform X1 [Styela clava]